MSSPWSAGEGAGVPGAGERWHRVDVLGTMVGLTAREKGFRVWLASGRELTLLRERLGQWFCDEQVE